MPSRPITWCQLPRSTWSPTSIRPSAYAACGSAQSASSRGSLPVTSVMTRRRPSWTRTTIRPSVLATSGSSTSVSWVLVPVAPFATPVSGDAMVVDSRAIESSIAIGHIRPPQPHGPTSSAVCSTYQLRSEPQSSNGTSPVALAAGAEGSVRTTAAEVASTPAATMPPSARVEMRPPPRAAFAGVSMCV